MPHAEPAPCAGNTVADSVDAKALVRWFATGLVALSLYITATTLTALAA